MLAIKALCVTGQSGNHGGFDFGAIEKAGLYLAHFTVNAHTGRSALHQEQIAGTEGDDGGEPAAEWRSGRGNVFRRFVGVVGIGGETIGFGELVHTVSFLDDNT